MFPVRISSHLINTQQTNDRRWAKEVIKGKNHKVGSQRLRLDILRFKLHSERIRKRKGKKKQEWRRSFVNFYSLGSQKLWGKWSMSKKMKNSTFPQSFLSFIFFFFWSFLGRTKRKGRTKNWKLCQELTNTQQFWDSNAGKMQIGNEPCMQMAYIMGAT